jgi:hypothetical protein
VTVGHITSDNAKNNTMMLQEFACCYEAETHTPFNTSRRHIRYAQYSMIQTYSIVSDIIPLFMQVPRAHHQLSHPRGYRHMQQVKIL